MTCVFALNYVERVVFSKRFIGLTFFLSKLFSQDLFEIKARVILPFESNFNTPPPFFINLFIE